MSAPADSMKSVLSHNIPKQPKSHVNVNIAFLTAAEKKVLVNSPAREISGGMARMPANKRGQELATARRLHEVNDSPITRSKGRSYGGGKSTIVF